MSTYVNSERFQVARTRALQARVVVVSVAAVAVAIVEVQDNERVRARRRERREEFHAKLCKQRSCWSQGWLLRRTLHGQYDQLMQELAAEDAKGFRAFQRLSPHMWLELLERVSPRIEKKRTVM